MNWYRILASVLGPARRTPHQRTDEVLPPRHIPRERPVVEQNLADLKAKAERKAGKR